MRNEEFDERTVEPKANPTAPPAVRGLILVTKPGNASYVVAR